MSETTLETLGEKMETMGEKMETMGEKMETMKGRMDTMGEKMETMGEKIETLGGRMDNLSEQTTKQIKALDAKVDKQGEELKQHVTDTVKDGVEELARMVKNGFDHVDDRFVKVDKDIGLLKDELGHRKQSWQK